jgi:uncharacterized membrane protein YdjX (TVP38/TMEM64 family)
VKSLVTISEKTFAKRKKLLASLNIAGLIGVFILLIWNYQTEGLLYIVSQGDAALIQEYFEDYSLWESGWIVFALVMIEVVIGIIPAVAMYPVVGLMTGNIWGILIISIGNVVGNTLNYWQGKFIAEAFVKNEKYLSLVERLEGGGLKELTILRANPMTSFDSVSYLAGALGMSYWKFLIATVVGVTPWIIIGVTVGGEILERFDAALTLLLGGVGVFVGYVIFKKFWKVLKKD